MSELSSLEAILEKLQVQYKVEPNFSFHDYQLQRVTDYNNSEGDLNTIDGYDCKICKNKGFIASVDNNDCEVHSFCQCQRIRATLRRARQSGLNDILSKYTFDKYNATEDWQIAIKDKAQRFCKDDYSQWFYIGGQVGSGKTHICTAISGHYIKAGKDVRYMLWCEESKKLKALVNDRSYSDEIAKYKNADVLYIDDFLKVKNGETPTNGDINLAFEIINHRLLSRDKITIISSEKTLDEVLDYDEGTMSRVVEKAGYYIVNIDRDRHKNYRLKGVSK